MTDLINRSDALKIANSAKTTDQKVSAIIALSAVAPTHAHNAGAVKVKPLVWEKNSRIEGWWQVEGWPCVVRSEGGIGYLVDYDSETLAGNPGGPHDTLEAAKAAAQADYTARIMAAIETTPDPRDEVIARLVEAVGNLLEIRAVWTDPYNDTDCYKARAALAAAKEVIK